MQSARVSFESAVTPGRAGPSRGVVATGYLDAPQARAGLPMLRLVRLPPCRTMPIRISFRLSSACPVRCVRSQRSIRLARCVAAAAAGFGLASCASTAVDAQWRNVELPAAYLRGATVLVSCEANEAVLQRLCEDQVVTELGARGARPVLAEPGTVAALQPGVVDMHYLPAARERGAKAVFSVTVGLASQRISPGFSIGIGGFGFGRHSSAGVGVSAPIGGGQRTDGYAANGRVTDVSSGRLMWTARASAQPSADAGAQIGELSKAVLDTAARAGLF